MSVDAPALRPHAFPPELSPEAAGHLNRFRECLAAVMPLKRKHAAMLPDGVAELSHSLTDERSAGFRPDYMGRPDLLAAYLHYFLPWNLYRLTRLFSGLPLALPPDGVVLDLGSGPLSAVMALWIARPELRGLNLRVHCLDKAARAMKLGVKLFRELAGADAPWSVILDQGAFGRMPVAKADLIIAANVLNELPQARPDREDDKPAKLAESLARTLAKTGTLLIVEPGTRLAARALVSLRENLAEEGLVANLPCPHGGECPMPGTGRKPWCHMVFGVRGAPEWLASLSARAGLPKRTASLSFLALGHAESARRETAVRILSDEFPLPGGKAGRYGCSAQGMVLLSGTRGGLPHSGALVQVAWPESPSRDPKSGALVVPWGASAAPALGTPASRQQPPAKPAARPAAAPERDRRDPPEGARSHKGRAERAQAGKTGPKAAGVGEKTSRPPARAPRPSNAPAPKPAAKAERKEGAPQDKASRPAPARRPGPATKRPSPRKSGKGPKNDQG